MAHAPIVETGPTLTAAELATILDQYVRLTKLATFSTEQRASSHKIEFSEILRTKSIIKIRKKCRDTAAFLTSLESLETTIAIHLNSFPKQKPETEEKILNQCKSLILGALGARGHSADCIADPVHDEATLITAGLKKAPEPPAATGAGKEESNGATHQKPLELARAPEEEKPVEQSPTTRWNCLSSLFWKDCCTKKPTGSAAEPLME